MYFQSQTEYSLIDRPSWFCFAVAKPRSKITLIPYPTSRVTCRASSRNVWSPMQGGSGLPTHRLSNSACGQCFDIASFDIVTFEAGHLNVNRCGHFTIASDVTVIGVCTSPRVCDLECFGYTQLQNREARFACRSNPPGRSFDVTRLGRHGQRSLYPVDDILCIYSHSSS